MSHQLIRTIETCNKQAFAGGSYMQIYVYTQSMYVM